MFKNTKRLQHDGGRAWIKDGQLHEARKNANGKLHTVHPKKNTNFTKEQDERKGSV